MACPEAMIKSLAAASHSADGQRLKETYEAITHNLSCSSTHRAGLESLVICSETALKVGFCLADM